MKLKFAFLCIDCTEVNDLAPRGKCNRCGSEAVFPLSRALAADPKAFLPRRLERSEAVERLERFAPLNNGRRPVVERI